jgi:hypothetical protein
VVDSGIWREGWLPQCPDVVRRDLRCVSDVDPGKDERRQWGGNRHRFVAGREMECRFAGRNKFDRKWSGHTDSATHDIG